MTLEQLRIFIAVAEREHVTRAADALALSQSAVSAAIASLETQYDAKLFDRVGRRIVLTAAGKAFLFEARAVIARAAEAENVLIDLTGLRRGTLSISASQTVANYWLPVFIHRFHLNYPGIRFNVEITNTEQVASQVAEGTVDLGFVEGQIALASVEVQVVAQDHMVLVAGAEHPWVQREILCASDALLHGPWILREPGSGTRGVFEELARVLDLDPAKCNVVLELPSNEAVRSAVEAGAGVTIISRLVAASSLSAGTLAALDWPLPSRDFLMLRHKERHTTAATHAFIDMVNTAYAAESNAAATPATEAS